LLWRGSGTGWNLLAGADVNRAEGVSHRNAVSRGTPRRRRRANPARAIRASRPRLEADALAGRPAQAHGRRARVLEPERRRHDQRRAWRARASGYRAFRAPTLNEMYREFRVGNAVTLANAALGPKR
jgi:hypothetical protein